MDIREVLQKRLSVRRVRDICDFVENLYLMDYDLMILMARKFFNLFCVFHELNCEKYERMKIPYIQENKRIVTDRALPLLKSKIGEDYKKVVIADDIIIYGRSIGRVYDEIEQICPDIEIYLTCYMMNHVDVQLQDPESILRNKVQYRYLAESDEWKMLSDEIVQIFYLSGRPYISYLPYYTLKGDWSKKTGGFDDDQVFHIGCDDMKHYGIKSFMYTGPELAIFRRLPFVKTCCLRFYYYKPIDKTVVIPYCSVDVLEDTYLEKLSDYIRKQYFTKEYRKLLKENSNGNAMRIMELEYTLSVWMAVYFFAIRQEEDYKWKRDIEFYNFVTEILPEKRFQVAEITNAVYELMKFNYEKVIPETQDYDKVLEEKFEALKKEYLKKANLWKGKKCNEVYESYIQRFLENYLKLNGDIDDEEAKKGSQNNDFEIKGRHYGLPISYILNSITEDYEKWGEKTPEKCEKKCYAAILCAADSGKGTIVTRHLKDKGISESLIYAGEQNYKFYENTNFPFLYGLYIIEQEGKRGIKRKKREFRIRFLQYLKANGIFYRWEETQQIMRMEISRKYGRFLTNSYDKHMKDNRSEKASLEKAVIMALEICGDN